MEAKGVQSPPHPPLSPGLPLCRLSGDSKVTFFLNLEKFTVKVREAHPETDNDNQGARLEGSPGGPAGKGGPGGREGFLEKRSPDLWLER